MLRSLIILIIVVAIAFAIWRAWVAIRAYMRGDLHETFGSGGRKARGWRVEQEESDDGTTVIVRVEHRRHGVRRSWTVDMTAEHARRDLVRVRADAEALASELNER